MIKLYSKKELDVYLKNDYLLEILSKHPKDIVFASHKWLLDIPAKRMIYADIYGPFLQGKSKRLLDVGGGFCGLSRELIKNNDYTLLDIMAHGDSKKIKKLSRDNSNFWVNCDWYEFKPSQRYDCIIANDIFPNVDQRLKLFIEKFRPYTNKIIISLTCYNQERHYIVKRVGADEILTIVPWSSNVTEMVLSEGGQTVHLPVPSVGESLFQNGRSVYRLDI